MYSKQYEIVIKSNTYLYWMILVTVNLQILGKYQRFLQIFVLHSLNSLQNILFIFLKIFNFFE